jgi:hypothetical protein
MRPQLPEAGGVGGIVGAVGIVGADVPAGAGRPSPAAAAMTESRSAWRRESIAERSPLGSLSRAAIGLPVSFSVSSTDSSEVSPRRRP